MLSRCTLAHYFTTVPRSLESIVSLSRAFHSSRPNLSVPLNTQRPMSAGFFTPRSGLPLTSSLSSSSQEYSNISDTSPLANDVSQRIPRQRRQAMTARESKAFNEMFTMIFDAATAQEKNLPSNNSVVGVGTDRIDDFISKLRKYPKRLKWSTELDDILDRQKEVINLFTTDQELLEWTTDAVFGESQRYEAAARKSLSEAASSGVKGEFPMLQPPTYPHLVALVMQTFREKFNDPHLALSIFEHARNLSTASYVFGCSSQAYHQLIETRWKCFQDLTGVLEALQEMQLNGVRVSGHTRQLVEKLRREIGEKHLWAEELEIGSSEVLKILAQIERLALSGQEAAPRGNGKGNALSQDAKWDEWKTLDSKDEGEDEWGFDQWSSPSRRVYADKLKGPTKGSVRPRRSEFENRSFEDEFSAGTSSSLSRDISQEDQWDFNFQSRDGQETELDEGRAFVLGRSASKQANFMDDWSHEDRELPFGVSSSETETYGHKDKRRFSPQEKDARDPDTLNEPERRGRMLKRRRFGLRADTLYTSQK